MTFTFSIAGIFQVVVNAKNEGLARQVLEELPSGQLAAMTKSETMYLIGPCINVSTKPLDKVP